MTVVASGSIRNRRSPVTPSCGMKAIPKSAQNTTHDGEAPTPFSTKVGNRSTGTPLARVTPEKSTAVPSTNRTPRSASRAAAACAEPPTKQVIGSVTAPPRSDGQTAHRGFHPALTENIWSIVDAPPHSTNGHSTPRTATPQRRGLAARSSTQASTNELRRVRTYPERPKWLDHQARMAASSLLTHPKPGTP